MTIALTATIPAYAHGGSFSPTPPPFIVIHSTEGPMSVGNARALAQWFSRSPANGGPGTSATKIWDPSEGIRMLSETVVPYHCGPDGNGRGTGDEHCGSVNLTYDQWMSANGQSMLDGSARANAAEAHRRGWSLSLCRWLTVSQVAAFQKGFCTHNDIRLALGGTTHSDPGPNFPYAWYLERVRGWYQDPTNGGDDKSMAAWDDTDSANLKKTADNIEKVYLGGVRAVNADGTSAPTAVNYSLRGVNEALDILNSKVDTLLAALLALPEEIAAALTPPPPPPAG